MAEVLSQSEINKLLGAVNGAKDKPEPPKDAQRRKVKMYDFKRPDKFSKDQIRTVQMMHENFARVTTTSLSATLRLIANAHVASVDQMTYSEFIRSVPNPSTLAIINMNPLRGSAIIEIDPRITFAMTDRMCGGSAEKPNDPKRELTDIELSLMESIIVRLIGNLRESWAQVIDLRPALGSIETNPQFAQMVHPNDMVVLITFDMKICGIEGMMNFCIPYITIEPIISKLSAQYWYAMVRGKGDGFGDHNPALVNGLKADSAVYIDSDMLSLADIGALKKGSLVKLPKYAKGIARLVSGEAPVLSLKHAGEIPAMQFTVVEPPVAVNQLLIGGKQEQAESIDKLMKTMTDTIAKELKNSTSELDKKIGELSQQQKEMAERFSYKGEANGSVEPAASTTPFGFIRDAETAFTFLNGEHTQTTALVLWYVDDEIAADIIGRFDVARQTDIASRIATMDRTSPEALKEVERVLQRKLAVLASAMVYEPKSGYQRIIDILNIASRNTERSVVEGLEKADPALAEEIKKRMFVFENVTLLDDRAIKAIIAHTDPKDLALALKAVTKNVMDHFTKNMTSAERDALTAAIQNMGHVRLTSVDEAQQRIVNVIRMLEGNGEILVARADETVV